MIYTTFNFEHDELVSDGYCDVIEVEIQIKSHDGINVEFEIISLYNRTQSKEISYFSLTNDAQMSLDLKCRRIAISESYEAYRAYLENSRPGGDYE